MNDYRYITLSALVSTLCAIKCNNLSKHYKHLTLLAYHYRNLFLFDRDTSRQINELSNMSFREWNLSSTLFVHRILNNHHDAWHFFNQIEKGDVVIILHLLIFKLLQEGWILQQRKKNLNILLIFYWYSIDIILFNVI